jgi:hemin uptake protein HemP
MNTANRAPDSPNGLAPTPNPERVTAALPAATGAISSEALLRGQPSVAIHHQGAVYRLQATRQGKLILTK